MKNKTHIDQRFWLITWSQLFISRIHPAKRQWKASVKWSQCLTSPIAPLSSPLKEVGYLSWWMNRVPELKSEWCSRGVRVSIDSLPSEDKTGGGRTCNWRCDTLSARTLNDLRAIREKTILKWIFEILKWLPFIQLVLILWKWDCVREGGCNS